MAKPPAKPLPTPIQRPTSPNDVRLYSSAVPSTLSSADLFERPPPGFPCRHCRNQERQDIACDVINLCAKLMALNAESLRQIDELEDKLQEFNQAL